MAWRPTASSRTCRREARRVCDALGDRDDSGASAVEYGLVVSLIAAVIVASVVLFGGRVGNLFDDSCSQINGRGTPAACADAP